MSEDVQLTKKMPLEEIQETREYAALTKKQQLWCATYIQNGLENGDYNPVLATMTAFNCKNMENARIMSYALVSNIHIIEVLNLHFRTEPIDAFLKMIDRAINNKHVTVAQVQALKLKCEVLGRANKLPQSATQSASQIEKSMKTPVITGKPASLRPVGRPRKNPEKVKDAPKEAPKAKPANSVSNPYGDW